MKLVNYDAAGFNDQMLEGLDYPHKTSEGAPQFLSEGVILRPHAPSDHFCPLKPRICDISSG